MAAGDRDEVWPAGCAGVLPVGVEGGDCALPVVAAGDEPDVATGAVVAPVPAFELVPAFDAVLAATCGARRTSATVPVNGWPPIDSMSNLTCDPRCTPPTSPSGTSASNRMRRRPPIVKRIGAFTEAAMVWPTSTWRPITTPSIGDRMMVRSRLTRACVTPARARSEERRGGKGGR